jgi:hypothetical protein
MRIEVEKLKKEKKEIIDGFSKEFQEMKISYEKRIEEIKKKI